MTPLSEELRQAFARLAPERFGLHFPSSRTPALDQGVDQAVASLGLKEPEELLEHARGGDDDALLTLADTLTVGETYFFRDPEHFALFREWLAHRDGHVEVWSAGCASGAEPYSLAIVALELLGTEASKRVSVLGTDVSAAALEAARHGVFRPWALRGTQTAFRTRWFDPCDGSFRVRDEVRQLVTFRAHNLREPFGPSWPRGIDVIFCRNVLVYFDDEGIAHAAEGMRRALAPGGLLVTGPSDPLLTRWGFRIDPAVGFITYRKDAVGGLAAPPPLPPPPPAPPPPRPTLPDERPPARSTTEARALADRGDTTGALRAVDKALREDPLDAGMWLLRAQLEQAYGRHDRVVHDARRALMLDRNLVLAHLVLAPSAWALGRHDLARQSIRSARAALGRLPPDTRIESAGTTSADLLGALQQMERSFDRSDRGP